jgi:hypothetical protein
MPGNLITPLNNAVIALCDQLPPTYTHPVRHQVNRLLILIGEHRTVAAVETLTEVIEEVTEALTTQARGGAHAG